MSPWVLGPGELDDIVFLPSIILGSVVLVIYICRCKFHRYKIEEFTVISIFLGSAGFVAGVVLMVNTVIAALTARQTPLAFYTFIAGVSVSIVSAKGLYHGIFKDGSKELIESLNSEVAQPKNSADARSRAAD